jgi:hypothetical protein
MLSKMKVSIQLTASLLVAVLLLGPPLAGAEKIEPDATELPLNQAVLNVSQAYPDGGEYNGAWTGSGTPEQIDHQGQRILAAGTGGTYCSGFTFATVMKTAREAGLLEGKSVEQVRRFQKEWYGAVQEPEMREKQCALAVGNLGIGRQVSPEEAEPGDFAQFWRARSGHSVVFLGWVYDPNGNRAGLKYRSSQGSTGGIGNKIEFFRDSAAGEGHVDPERIYFARLGEFKP